MATRQGREAAAGGIAKRHSHNPDRGRQRGASKPRRGDEAYLKGTLRTRNAGLRSVSLAGDGRGLGLL